MPGQNDLNITYSNIQFRQLGLPCMNYNLLVNKYVSNHFNIGTYKQTCLELRLHVIYSHYFDTSFFLNKVSQKDASC